MGKKVISSNIYKVWIPFTVIGIFVSVLLDHLINKTINFDLAGQVEVYSAVWFVVLGLALLRLETVLERNK